MCRMGEAALVGVGLGAVLLDACAVTLSPDCMLWFFFSGDKEMKSTQLRVIVFRGKEWKVRLSDTHTHT